MRVGVGPPNMQHRQVSHAGRDRANFTGIVSSTSTSTIELSVILGIF